MWNMTIGDIPSANARRTPTAVAYVDGLQTHSWADVEQRSTRLGNALRAELGLGSSDVAAVLSDNCVAHPEVIFACSKIGAIYTGLNTRHHPREMAAHVIDAGASVLVVGPGFEDAASQVVAETGVRVVAIDHGDVGGRYDDLVRSGASKEIERHDDADKVYNLSYTSGTTGEPKGAMISSRNMLAFVRSLGWVARSSPEDRHLINLPMFHAGGHFATIHPAFYGLATVVLRRPDPAETVDMIRRHAVTTFLSVPIAMKMLVDHLTEHPANLDTLRVVLYGSNPVPEQVLREFDRLVGCGLAQIGGMGTEGGIGLALSPEQHASAFSDANLVHRLRSCGTVQPGVELRLVDENDDDVGAGKPGEMLFRGDAFVSGYWKRREASEFAWRGGWFHSGDIGVLDHDGFVTYVDRKSGRIKTGAETVYAREIEAAILTLDGVVDCCVVGVPDPKWNEAVWAVVETSLSSLSEDRIRDHVRCQLSGYKVPKRVFLVDALPRTALGKVSIGEVKAFCAGRNSLDVHG